jgi:GNAT superfamily N-acetyltransferase
MTLRRRGRRPAGGITIRRAVASDAEERTRVAHAAKRHWGYAEALVDSWRADLTVTPRAIAEDLVFCAESAGRIVGFYAVSRDGERFELEHMWVLPEHIGTGIGERLFRHAEGAVAAAGPGELEIASDPNAEGFYRRMGARRAGALASPTPGRELPRLVLDVPARGSASDAAVRLRPTHAADLPFVLALERDPANAPFIGQWSADEHLGAIADPSREHWILEDQPTGARRGYLVAFDLVSRGRGVYVKRIVVGDKSRGTGRRALAAFVAHARRRFPGADVWLTVFADNERARRAYAAAGFAEVRPSPEARAELCAAVGGFSDTSVVMALRRSG